ncbi:hypothetical protein G6L89_010300 [Agrobacterium fabrum]|uniref:hypothetical protein n=1 Tax=Agrobacterium fabrum TaxID=1176649 RepID=UPI001571843B|nr:hypothetical protein [Agrobacterium fabrum]NTB08219.1 hypothetical protein [Agrobacterium fabrum]
MTKYRGIVYPKPHRDFPELAVLLDENGEIAFYQPVADQAEGEKLLAKIKVDLEKMAKEEK